MAEETLSNVIRKKEMTSITLAFNEVITWTNPDGSLGESTTPKEITLSLSDLSAAAQAELQGKL